MSKILYLTVGKAPVPVYICAKYFFHEYQDDRVILVHSEETKTIAEQVKKAIKGSKSFSIECFLVNDIFEITKYPKYPETQADEEVFLNITGGKKVMGMLLYRSLSANGNKPIPQYYDFTTNSLVTIGKTGSSTCVNPKILTLDDYKSLKGDLPDFSDALIVSSNVKIDDKGAICLSVVLKDVTGEFKNANEKPKKGITKKLKICLFKALTILRAYGGDKAWIKVTGATLDKLSLIRKDLLGNGIYTIGIANASFQDLDPIYIHPVCSLADDTESEPSVIPEKSHVLVLPVGENAVPGTIILSAFQQKNLQKKISCILIHSELTRFQAQTLVSYAMYLGIENCTMLNMPDTIGQVDLQKKLTAHLINTTNITFDITGGTKFWSFLLSMWEPTRSQIITHWYLDPDDREIHEIGNKESGASWKKSQTPEISTYCNLQGFCIDIDESNRLDRISGPDHVLELFIKNQLISDPPKNTKTTWSLKSALMFYGSKQSEQKKYDLSTSDTQIADEMGKLFSTDNFCSKEYFNPCYNENEHKLTFTLGENITPSEMFALQRKLALIKGKKSPQTDAAIKKNSIISEIKRQLSSLIVNEFPCFTLDDQNFATLRFSEIDVVFLRDWVFYGISCTHFSGPDFSLEIVKEHAWEIIYRTKQLGGYAAKSMLVISNRRENTPIKSFEYEYKEMIYHNSLLTFLNEVKQISPIDFEWVFLNHTNTSNATTVGEAEDDLKKTGNDAIYTLEPDQKSKFLNYLGISRANESIRPPTMTGPA